MSASISPCGKYRYHLGRTIHNSYDGSHKPITFVMLNPSTADSEMDDPTIRKCKAFVDRLGGTHLNVVNLFAYRSTDWKALKSVADPVGPENDWYLDEWLRGAYIRIAAWGRFPIAQKRGQELVDRFGEFKALRLTKSGAPWHPLMMPYGKPLVDFRGVSNG